MYVQQAFPAADALRGADAAQTTQRVPASRNLDRVVTSPRYSRLPIFFKCNGKLSEYNQTTLQIQGLDLPPAPALTVRPVSVRNSQGRVILTLDEKINFVDGDPSESDFPNVLVPHGGAFLATRRLTQGAYTETGAVDEDFTWSFEDVRLYDYESSNNGYELFAQGTKETAVLGHDNLNFDFDWTLSLPAVLSSSTNPTVEVTFVLEPNPYWSRVPTDANVTYEPR